MGTVIDEDELEHKCTWSCRDCSQEGSGDTKTEALTHADRNPGHVVVIIGVSIYKATACNIGDGEPLFRGRPVRDLDLPLPGESLE